VVIADSAGSLALPEVRYDYYDPARGWRQATARPVVLPVQPAPPLDRQRPAPTLLNREPLGLTGLRGWVSWLVLILGILPPLAVLALRFRPRRAEAPPARAADAPERLQAAVRAVVPHPERRREAELVTALREAGFDHAAGEEVARLYYQVAVRRFAPAGWGDEDVERRAEQVLARWPRRVRSVLASLLLLLVAAPAVGQKSSADSLYATQRFAAAAALYHQDAARDPTSPRRWYAAGAAAWAAGQNASAAAAWLNALRLAPRSPDVRQAWRQVSRLSADLQQAGRVVPITPVELLLLGAMVWTAGWGLIALRRHRIGIAVLIGAALIAMGAWWLDRDQARPIAVLARTVRLREAPHGLADESGTADELAVVTLLEQRGGWRLVQSPSGARGWVPVTALAEVRGLNSRT
jgi:tetratricopeptide (TPR) repeat protein